MAPPLVKAGSVKLSEGVGIMCVQDGGGGGAGGEAMKIWVPDKDELWQLARVVRPSEKEGEMVVQPIGDDGEDLAPRDDDDGGEVEVACDVTQPWDETHGEDLSDIALMNDLNEAPMLHLLRRRFFADDIYTYSSSGVLISINPYRPIPKLYELGEPAAGQQAPPHVHAIAKNAFDAMLATGQSQALLINGESGAGKTEASKFAVRYLAQLSESGGGGGGGGGKSVEQLIIDSSPLLEAFGNARTRANANSSRFGKFLVIHYALRDGGAAMAGASIDDFLLEKV